ncbi:MAG TPA: TetR/AcrR family transcriptional regulator [Solirubrobacteraceae bacterium]|nr:TetR/AcrR family transcriptional regulator [Solirubrobacteraceae bacterium]
MEKARTREAIVAAAHAQVAEDGYASASVVAVARRAGVATGTVYRYFPSKAALFAEVFRRAATAELALIAGIVESPGPPRGRLGAAVEAFARRALAAPTLVYALMAEPVDPAIEAERLASKRAWRALFAGLLREGVESGDLAPLDPEVTAAALVGGMQEALLLPPGAGHEALVASLVSFSTNAVGAGNGSRQHA